MSHEEFVLGIINTIDKLGKIKSRERNDLEYKESFGPKGWAKYAKTMAAFANNHGGYILFGIKDNPREFVGINDSFRNFEQEKFTEYLNNLYSPELLWETGVIDIDEKSVGYIYTAEANPKPVIAIKVENSEKINNGDIYYRYRGRSEKIKYPEMNHIIEDRAKQEREQILKLIETIRKNGTANLGIINYSSGKFSTPYGVDVAIDRKLVAKVLKKAKFIKEGSFNETTGIPVIKVTGEIALAEEIPVPDINPDEGYPYIQAALAKKLNIKTQELYALIWYYKMKEAKRYSIGVTVSQKGNPSFKFSEFALQFLNDKIEEFKNNDVEFDKIKIAYNNRNKKNNNPNE